MSDANEALQDTRDDDGVAQALAYLGVGEQAEKEPEGAPEKQQAEEAKEPSKPEAEAPESDEDEGKPEEKAEDEYGWVADESVRADLAAANLKPEVLDYLKGTFGRLADAEKNYARGFHRRMRDLSAKEKAAEAVQKKAENYDRLMDDPKIQAAFKAALASADQPEEDDFDEDLASPEERRAHYRKQAREAAREEIEAERAKNAPKEAAEAIREDLVAFYDELKDAHGLTQEEFNQACFAVKEQIEALGIDASSAVTPENVRGWLAGPVESILTKKRLTALETAQKRSKADAARGIRATTPPPSGPASGSTPKPWQVDKRPPTADEAFDDTLDLLRKQGIDLSVLAP